MVFPPVLGLINGPRRVLQWLAQRCAEVLGGGTTGGASSLSSDRFLGKKKKTSPRASCLLQMFVEEPGSLSLQGTAEI